MMQRYEQEIFKKPLPRATTRSATGPATTQVTDLQLQRAIDTMVALVVLVGDREAVGGTEGKTIMPSLPVTRPAATTPASAPTTAPAPAPATAPKTAPPKVLPGPEDEIQRPDDPRKRMPPEIVPDKRRPAATTNTTSP